MTDKKSTKQISFSANARKKMMERNDEKMSQLMRTSNLINYYFYIKVKRC